MKITFHYTCELGSVVSKILFNTIRSSTTLGSSKVRFSLTIMPAKENLASAVALAAGTHRYFNESLYNPGYRTLFSYQYLHRSIFPLSGTTTKLFRYCWISSS